MTSLPRNELALDIALTSTCPLRCRYCSVERKSQPELTASQWEAVVASFARVRRIDLISLEGGEPFGRPDLPAILGACLDAAQAVKIVTSGVIPFQSLPDGLLLHPRFILELSLDGPREVHDFLRDGSWERAWNFLQTGLERGIRMRLRSGNGRPLRSAQVNGVGTAVYDGDTIALPLHLQGKYRIVGRFR